MADRDSARHPGVGSAGARSAGNQTGGDQTGGDQTAPAAGAVESLSELVWSTARGLRHLSGRNLAQWDVAPSQARALRVLLRHGTMRLSELSDHLHIAARSTTEVVDALQDRGLVERRPDPHDRRATLVASTPKGVQVGEEIRAGRTAGGEEFFAVLSETDRRHLARILSKLK